MKTRTRHYAYIFLAVAMIAMTACRTGVNGANPRPTSGEPDSTTPESSTPNEDQPTDTPPVTDGVVDESLVFGKDASAPSSEWSKPELGESYTDPAYGTQVTRVTSAEGDRFNRNSYSRRQAENVDGTLFFTYHGSSRYHVYKVDSNELVAELEIHPDSEPQWHPTDPEILRHTTGPNASVGTLTLQETDITSGTTKTIADLGDRLGTSMNGALYLTERSEGSPSADGNRYAWMIYNEAEKPIGIVSYDLARDEILGTIAIGESPKIDWVSMSPSGTYVVTSSDAGTYVYDADLSNKRLLTEAIEHSDIGYDLNGTEAYVYIDFESDSATAGWLVSVNMETLDRTKIFDIYDGANSSVHVSAKNYDKPGWALVSSYNCKVDGAWTCDKVFAVELQPNGRIINLAHTYNCGDDYWTETQAVVNRDFSRVYFNSDSGSCGIDAEVFRIDVPEFN